MLYKMCIHYLRSIILSALLLALSVKFASCLLYCISLDLMLVRILISTRLLQFLWSQVKGTIIYKEVNGGLGLGLG